MNHIKIFKHFFFKKENATLEIDCITNFTLIINKTQHNPHSRVFILTNYFVEKENELKKKIRTFILINQIFIQAIILRVALVHLKLFDKSCHVSVSNLILFP
jgi:hypothetical protein